MELNLNNDKKYLEIRSMDSYEELEQLKFSLTKKVKNYRFIPSVKAGLWDGNVSFLEKDKLIKSGLWKEVRSILTKFDYRCKITGLNAIFDNNIDKSDFAEFAKKLFDKHEIKPRSYQIESAFKILKYRRSISLLGTSAGKTVIIYIVIAYGLARGLMKNVLMIVPNVSLVVQANNDFLDYNFKNDLIKLKIQQVYSGKERNLGSNVTIGTYQSLVKFKQDYFNKYDAVLIDEAHKSKSNSILKIMDKLWHCNYRFGLTGTLPADTTADYLTILSQTGPVINEYNSDFLMKGDFIAPVNINIIRMDYAPDDAKEGLYALSKKLEPSQLFLEEKKYVATSKKRLQFISSFINKSTKNSLVLFHLIDHGKALYKELVAKRGKANVFYIDGKTKTEDRELIKSLMEKSRKETFYTFETDIGAIKIKHTQKVLLANGKYKLAKDILEGDDIDNKFLSNKIK